MNRTIVRLTVLFAALAAVFTAGTTTIAQRGRARVEWVNGREAVPREVLVKFRQAPQADVLSAIGDQTGAEAIQTIGRAGLRRIRARALDVPALLRVLANHPDVLYAEPNYLVQAFTEPNDPSFPQLWGLEEHRPGRQRIGRRRGRRHSRGAGVGRVVRFDGAGRRGRRHRHRLHASGSRGEHLVGAGSRSR